MSRVEHPARVEQPVLADRTHGRMVGVALYTLVRKEIGRFLRIWTQTLLPPVITMSLYLLIFGTLIGPRIGDMGGVPYMTYIAPGIIMMSVITGAYSNVVSSFFGARFQRFIEEILVSPTPIWVVLVGYVAGGVARGLLVGLLVSLVAVAFTGLEVHNLAATVIVVFLTATLFSIAGLVNGIFARSFDDVSIVPTFILTPLTYLGGVFYSIDLLPDFWRAVSALNPILYMVNGFRQGMLGVSDIPLSTALPLIVVFIAVLGFLAYRLLKRGVGFTS